MAAAITAVMQNMLHIEIDKHIPEAIIILHKNVPFVRERINQPPNNTVINDIISIICMIKTVIPESVFFDMRLLFFGGLILVDTMKELKII